MPSSPRAIFFASRPPPPSFPSKQMPGVGGGGAGPSTCSSPCTPGRRQLPSRPHVRLMFRLSLATNWSRGLPFRRNSLRIANNNTNTGGPCSVLRCPQCARHQAGFIAGSPDCKGSFMSPHNATTERHCAGKTVRAPHSLAALRAHHHGAPHVQFVLIHFLVIFFQLLEGEK